MLLESARREAVPFLRERARKEQPQAGDYFESTALLLEPTRVAVVAHSNAARWHAEFLAEQVAATCQTGTDEAGLQSGLAGAAAAFRIETRRRGERPSRPSLAVAVLRGREAILAVSGLAAIYVPTEGGWERYLGSVRDAGVRTGTIRIAPGDRLLLVSGPGAEQRGESLPHDPLAAYGRLAGQSPLGAGPAVALVSEHQTQLWPDEEEIAGAEVATGSTRPLSLVERWGGLAAALVGLLFLSAALGLRGVSAEAPQPVLPSGVENGYLRVVAALAARGESADVALARLKKIGLNELPSNFNSLPIPPVQPRPIDRPAPSSASPSSTGPLLGPEIPAQLALREPDSRLTPSSRGQRTSTPVPEASPATKVGRVAALDGALLRADTSTQALVVLRIPNGAKVEVLEQVNGQSVNGREARWHKVRYQEKIGYLYFPLVTLAEE
ncbi:MAG: hypothetical protein HY329_16930 [Chloroflexi bacterium]|nr:hypothetical protein [Chloroflexota bacterium]